MLRTSVCLHISLTPTLFPCNKKLKGKKKKQTRKRRGLLLQGPFWSCWFQHLASLCLSGVNLYQTGSWPSIPICPLLEQIAAEWHWERTQRLGKIRNIHLSCRIQPKVVGGKKSHLGASHPQGFMWQKEVHRVESAAQLSL